MDKASYFIKDKALFGGFPTQSEVDELENEGVRYFVNLTHSHENNITPYRTKYRYISHPIEDHRVPHNWKMFSIFIVYVAGLITALSDGKKLYLHCKGGHGRSGIVVACLYAYIYTLKPDKALEYTLISHSKRRIMKNKWRSIGSPQTSSQKNFVHKFFEPIYFYRAYRNGYTAGFSMFTDHAVTTSLGTFPTAEAALQAYKAPENKEYVERQQHTRSPLVARSLGRKVDCDNAWTDNIEKYMDEILENKFRSHPELKENLMNTGLRPIIYHTLSDSFMGEGDTGSGNNILGNALFRLKEKFYMEEAVY